ncbi:SIMPL domain-containing protein [Clostridium sp. SHJSY1]|uniref:SIMPL domain-containing protein n=1 Tax=Clostridium sp. SHJSY1 TaxID=2942483 RepID=UPI002876E3E0|nr:SIMPL domain-containing protein [Clostridium sp. SHJSY1]MDS0525114.1 SIMPL domain-containing protein [Clostridium sp. SHJSY1]
MYSSRESDNYCLSDYGDYKRTNKIRVSGKGVLKAQPDLAEIQIGVVTENQELQLAQEENAKITQNVINGIKAMGISDRFIQTENYNIKSNYDYVDGKQVFRGYEVSNFIKVIITNIGIAGGIIDTAVSNGANSVSDIKFIVSDEKRHYYEALNLAIEDAQNKAVVMANKLRVHLNVVPSEINERSSGIVRPLSGVSYKAAGVSTPIESGENEIIAEIDAIFLFH